MSLTVKTNLTIGGMIHVRQSADGEGKAWDVG